jgi:hypothetical protein
MEEGFDKKKRQFYLFIKEKCKVSVPSSVAFTEFTDVCYLSYELKPAEQELELHHFAVLASPK